MLTISKRVSNAGSNNKPKYTFVRIEAEPPTDFLEEALRYNKLLEQERAEQKEELEKNLKKKIEKELV